MSYFVGDSWTSQLTASVCHQCEGGAAAVEGQPTSQSGGLVLLPLEEMARDPMHVNGELILQNLNTTKNFVHAIRSMGQAMLLVSKVMDVVEALHFFTP